MKQLSERKRRAVELITLGRLSPGEAAGHIGVRPATVREWFRTDATFREHVETWRAGPPVDGATVAQARRLIIDELAGRALHRRSMLSIRELLGIYDRLTKERDYETKEGTDDDSQNGNGEIELTPEQAERIWAEIDRQSQGPEGDASPEQVQS